MTILVHFVDSGVRIIKAISFQEMQAFSDAELVERMDLVLRTARAERMHPHYNEDFDFDPYVFHFFHTQLFQKLPPENIRPAVWKTFDFIVQMEYVRSYSGFQNSLPLPQFHGEPWASPRHLIPFLAQEQAEIIGTRVVLERFMDLIHYLVNGRELSGSSKFGAFKDWLFNLPLESNWFYLLPLLPWLRSHDKYFRTPEVHDGSKLKKYLVTLQNIHSDQQNDSLELINLLANLWRNILPIFDGKKANSVGGVRPSRDIQWLGSYLFGSIDDLKAIKAAVEAELRTL